MKERAQSAMEYLMTYGWAILIIAVVLGVMFQAGIFSGSSLTPKAQAGACQVERLAGQVSLEGECQGQLPQFVGQFNGSIGGWSYINVGNGALQNVGTQGLTISAWVVLPSTNSGDLTVISKRDSGSTTNTGYQVQDDGTTMQVFFCDGSAARIIDSSPANFNNNQWQFLTVVFVRSGNIIVYDNGAAQSLASQTSISAQQGSISNTQNVLIGSQYSNGNPLHNLYTGSMADVQVYNTSLAASEVQELYLEGIGGAPVRIQNLVGWWPLNGNAQDYSGYNNNGQTYNGVAYNSTWSSSYTAP